MTTKALLLAATMASGVAFPAIAQQQPGPVQGLVDGLLGGIFGGGARNLPPPQPILAEEGRRQMVNALSAAPYNIPRAEAETFASQLAEALTRDNAQRSFVSASGVRVTIVAGATFTRAEGQCRLAQAGMKRAAQGPDELRIEGTFCWTGQHWGTLGGNITGALSPPRQQQQTAQQGRQQPTLATTPQPQQQPQQPPPNMPVAEELDETRTVRTATVLRTAPSSQSASLRQLAAGGTIQLTGNLRNSPWVRVEVGGTTGWVLSSSLNPPEEAAATPTRTQPASSPTSPAPAPQAAAQPPVAAPVTPIPPTPVQAAPQAVQEPLRAAPPPPVAQPVQEAPRPAPPAPPPVQAASPPPQPAPVTQPPASRPVQAASPQQAQQPPAATAPPQAAPTAPPARQQQAAPPPPPPRRLDSAM